MLLADELGGVELWNNRAGFEEELAARVASGWSRRTGAGANRMPEVVNTDGAIGIGGGRHVFSRVRVGARLGIEIV